MRIILPTLSKCSNDEPLVIFPITPINTAISIIIAVSPINPFIAFSGFIFPINLTVAANNNIAIPICIRPVFRPSILTPFPIVIEASFILSTAIARPIRTAESKITVPRALPKSLSGILEST